MAHSARKPEGVWLLHKPAGPASFEALDGARALFSPSRACHAGALDPFASGLLALLAGRAVHVFHAVHELPKTYTATVAWGAATDNLDPLGQVVARGDASHLEPARLEAALREQLGWREQVPPKFSNKRIGGERAWRLARQGRDITLPAQRVYLHRARWLDHDLPRTSRLSLTCRGGYYVRALARDLGQALGCPAHLAALHRDAIGPWACPDPGATPHLSLDEALPWLPVRTLTDAELGVLRGKGPIPAGSLEPAPWPLPEGFPAVTFARAVHGSRTAALLKADAAGPGWAPTAVW